MDTTSVKLDNVCQHGFWVGQGAAPCPFCHPECYANGTQGTIAPLITVNVNTIFDAVKDARIAALESSLAERERECERLKTLVSDEANDTDELRDAIDEFLPSYLLDDGTDEPANHVETVEYAGDEIRRLTRRAEAAEVALAAAREENERLRKRIDAEYERGFSHADSLADSYLRSRDEGRVERAKRCMQACLDDQEIDYTVTDAEARAVLAAADRREP